MDTAVGANPFPGLRPFMPEEADLFFGRDKQSDELVRRLASRRFLAVVGTSGSGKSSLVRAGLLPSLESGFMAEAGAHWRIAILRPQDDPIGFLARAMVETGMLAHLGLDQPTAEGVVETLLRRSSLGLVEVARLARLELHENLLIVVDQFEELFRFADLARQRGAGDEAPAFVKLLLETARQQEIKVYVVLTMRSDFLGDCARFRDLPEAISDSQYLIPRLTRDELHAVITGPIGVRGGRIAPSLVQRLLNDVGDDMDQLPVLQHALMRAWDHWEAGGPADRPIDLNDLEAIGGMAEALSRHADEAFGSLTTERDRKIAERLFKCLTERGSDNRETRRPTQLSRIAAIANAAPAEVGAVVDVFRAPRRSFLMPPHGVALEDGSVIDISHESLIRQWGRLRSWVEEEAESRATYLRLVEAAQLHAAGRAGLWGEPDLTFARQWQEREAPNATWAARYGAGFEAAGAFLGDSEAAHRAELEEERRRAEAERAAKERELEQARTLADAQRLRADEQAAARVRQRRLSWGLAILLVAAMAAGGFGWHQQRLAKREQFAAQVASRLAEDSAASAKRQEIAANSNAVKARQQEDLARKSAERAAEERDKALAARQEAEKQEKLAGEQRRRAETQQREAESQGRIALSRQLTALASNDIGQGRLQRAFLFGAAAYRAAPVSEARQILQRTFGAQPQLRMFLSGHLDGADSVAFSSDRTTLASAGADGTVILWNVASGARLTELRTGRRARVGSVAFSPDGKTVAGASDTVDLWDVASRARTSLGEVPQSHRRDVKSVAFSPDGELLAVAGDSAATPDTVVLWDVKRRTLLGELAKGPEGVRDVTFSPDGKTLASAGADKTVVLWDVASRAPLITLKGHDHWVWGLAFNHDGTLLASASQDKTVILWDVARRARAGEPLKGHDAGVWSVAFSPDGKTLASAGDDQAVILWNVARRIPIGDPLKGHRGRVRKTAFSADGQTLASAGDTVILWDTTSRTPLAEPLSSGRRRVSSVSFSPDGRTLASASDAVTLWDVARRTSAHEPLKDGAREVNSVAFSHDGRTLASGGRDGILTLWDVERRTPLAELLKGHPRNVSSVAFSPDGKTLASAVDGGTVILWDVARRTSSGELFKGFPREVTSLAFSPDGKTLASGHQTSSAFGVGSVVLWDVASGKSLVELSKGHQHGVAGVAFSPDGKTLASGDWGKDGAVILWDVASRTSLGEALKAHPFGASSLAFSRDGKTLASAGGGGEVILWDVARRRPLGDPFKGHRLPVLSVAFSRDGKMLASAGTEGTLILWDLDVASWIRKACAIANRNLTRREWAQSVGEDVPYQTLCPALPQD